MTHHTHATSNSEPTAVDVLPGRFLPTPALATSDPLPAEVVRRHTAALADKRLLAQARELSVLMQQQLDAPGALEAVVGAVVAEAHATGIDPSECIRARIHAVRQATDGQRAEKELVVAKMRALKAREEPLRSAIARLRSAALGSWPGDGLSRLRERIRTLSEPLPGADRYQRAIDAGVPPERLAGLYLHEPESRRLERERLETEMAGHVAALAAIAKFESDGDVQHLAGLGLDELVQDFVASKDLPL